MAGIRQKPQANGKFVAWYIDAAGKQRFVTGTRSKAETLRMAERIEDEQRQIRLGYRPAPKSAEKHRNRPFAEVAGEYLAWGEAQGGKSGMSWSKGHLRMRQSRLGWWRAQLGLQTLADLDGILPRVEKALRELHESGRAGKTIENYSESLKALCLWCVARGYLQEDPLKSLEPYDKTPQSMRRALTVDEIKRLLDVASPCRALTYETALTSGLRAGELRALSVNDLDTELCGLHLNPRWTKNRKPGFQPIPADLVRRLAASAAQGEAQALYDKWRTGAYDKAENPLLYVPRNAGQMLDEDLAEAGIPKRTIQGKIDFHSLRVSFVTLVSESGATVKETQSLARHATPQMTMNVYAKVREDRLSQVAERVGKVVNPGPEYAVCRTKRAAGAEGLDLNALRINGLNASAEKRKGRGESPPRQFAPDEAPGFLMDIRFDSQRYSRGQADLPRRGCG
ncbi:MAG: site-specific integrase [Planctomycetota bacterium]